jgi:hypothetical protein
MRKLLAMVLAAIPVVLAAAPAQAGGPTSVLITDPSSGRAGALYYTDARYTQLDELLQRGESITSPGPSAMDGQSYNVTWMIHDVLVWRQQQVFVGDAGVAYVATTNVEGVDQGADNGLTWTRLADGTAALDLLRDAASGAGESPGVAAFEPEPTERVVTVTKTSTEWFALAGWRWVVPGILLGVAAGALLTRRPRVEVARPRQQLVDRPSERADVT